MRARVRAGVAALLLGPAFVALAPRQDAGPFDLYQAHSQSSLAPDSHAGGTGFTLPPVSEWRWYEGEPGCTVSPIAAKVDRVVREITRKGDDPRLRDEALLTTRRNAFGPTLLDSKAIFMAAGRLIEAADVEIDLVSFAMEPQAEPYLELVRGFERRLLSGRPLAAPFRIRIYTDHLSAMFLGGTARPKARSLLSPWLRLFQVHGLDPGAVRIEVYVHAHGAFFYTHGGRYSVHDKLLIVDGRYVHIGGANPQAKNNYAHPERDSAVVVKGEVAVSALAAFDALWSESDFACTIERRGRDYRPACVNRDTPFRVEHNPEVAAPQFERAGLSADACVPMVLLSKQRAGFRNVAGYSNPWAKGLLAAVSAAERDIALSSPNMNAPPLQGALVEALGTRDVRVRLLLPYERNEAQVNALGGFGSNERSMSVLRACALVARGRSDRDYQRFVDNFQGGWWVAEGQRERFSGDGPGCFHTKFASFDDRAVILGSGNLDDQSFYHSSETSILVDSPVVTKAVRQFLFEGDWTRAERFDLSMPLLGPEPPKRDTAADRLMADASSLCAGLGFSLK